MPVKATTAQHEALRLELLALIQKHVPENFTPLELLAITANTLGQILAMQDQRLMSSDQYMQVVVKNMEIGNAHVIEQMLNAPTLGRA